MSYKYKLFPSPKNERPKNLFIDIETAPILANVWRIFDENIGTNQIVSDWYILSYAAKWEGDPPEKTMYRDQKWSKDIENDKEILEDIWKLLDEADFVIGHYSKSFDIKKINARFLEHGMPPPAGYRQIDTKEIAKRVFGFTSNKLEYLCNKLNKTYKKYDHKEYQGFELWKACLSGDRNAWRVMEKYNRYDVLALEELYTRLAPWDKTNFFMYNEEACKCGSTQYKKNGFHITDTRKYQRFKCVKCGFEWRSTKSIANTKVTSCAR